MTRIGSANTGFFRNPGFLPDYGRLGHAGRAVSMQSAPDLARSLVELR